MILITPTYLFLIFLFIAAVAVGGIIAKNSLLKSKDTPKDDFKILPYIEDLLRQINCVFSHTVKEQWHEFNFKYQNGNFIIICRENDNFVRIHYPHFFSTTIEELDLVRESCNACNAHGFSHHVLYTSNGKDNEIALHIASSLVILDQNERYANQLSDILSHFFSLAQEFYLRFDKNKERYKDVTPHDAEKEFLKNEREFFMLKEMEIRHQPTSKRMVASPGNPLSLQQILSCIYGWDHPEFIELKIVTHQLKTIVYDKDIAEFDLSQVLIASDSEGHPNFTGRNATLILAFSQDKNKPDCFPLQLIISLRNEGSTPESLYQRATLSMHPIEAHNKNAEYDKTTTPKAVSFIFAYDLKTREEIDKTFRSEIDDLTEKCNNSDFKNLSSQQFLAFKYENPDVEYQKIHAENLFRQKRYYETIVEMEYLYNYLSPRFTVLSKKEQNTFYEICYYIGFSYCELGLNQKAYFYLDAIFALNHIPYLEEYVNCLVNAKDFRALSVIDNIENAVRNQINNGNYDASERLKRFANFLERRKAHHLIDLGYYEKAKQIYQKLYLDPESQDYALNELAYLQKLETKKEEKTSEDNQEDN